MSVKKHTHNIHKNVHRYDRYGIPSSIKRTPQGFIRVPASITRVGVLTYKLTSGDEWRELRLPEEVFRSDSLETLSNSPVTDDHHGLITPENVRAHAVGYVSGEVSHNDRCVTAELMIQDSTAIEGIGSKRLKEVSAGYISDIEISSGVYNGEHYDAIQRNIRYNHVALGPENWARGGSELVLHLDSKETSQYIIGVGIHMDSAEEQYYNSSTNKNRKKGIEMKKIVMRLDGIAYEIEVPEQLAATFEASIQKQMEVAKAAIERADSLQGQLDVEKKNTRELEDKLKAATNPTEVEKAVNERIMVIQDCQKLYPEIEVSGKSIKELKTEALEKVGYDVSHFDKKSDGYLEGVFSAETKKYAEKNDQIKKEEGSWFGTERQDKQDKQDNNDKAIDPYDSDASRKRMIERSKTAYQTGIF